MIRFDPALIRCIFTSRENRFRAVVSLDGEPVAAHVANSGRLRELLVAGATCYVSEAKRTDRQTRYDLKLIDLGHTPVCIDAHMTNAIFADAIASGALEPFHAYRKLQPEVRRGESRLDFRLSAPGLPAMWVETKSVTLVQEGVARFPDAPTARGARHLAELSAAVASGERAAAVFVIQRSDAAQFSPNGATDPAFCEALARSAAAGVEIYALVCEVTTTGIGIAREVPIVLP